MLSRLRHPIASSLLMLSLLASFTGSVVATGCGKRVNCEALCARMLACDVAFFAPDDPNGEKVRNGERDDLESCTLGCQESNLVTIDSASCIDELDVGNPDVCQLPTLNCLGVDPNDAIVRDENDLDIPDNTDAGIDTDAGVSGDDDGGNADSVADAGAIP